MSKKRTIAGFNAVGDIESENASVSESAEASEKGSENASVNTTESVSEHVPESINDDTPISGLGNIDINKIVSNKKSAKPKFEETHTKNTYWIRNDILDALNKIATNRGEKTQAINEGLLLYFERLQNRK